MNIFNIFQPKIITTLKDYNANKLVNDLIAGVIVAIIALPLSVALAIASGVSPVQGLYTAIIAGFIIAFLGGSKVNISGPTAAFATIVAGVVMSYGISGLVVATIMAGIILIIMGALGLGAFIKYIPMPLTTGFTAGIAVTLVIGQIKDFLGLTFAPGTNAIEAMEKVEAVAESISTINIQAIMVGVIGLAILILWPLLDRPRFGMAGKICGKIPPSIIAIVVGILMVNMLHLDVNTIGTLYPDLSSELPKPTIPEINFDLIRAVTPSALTIAALAAIESLLSCVVSDGMIDDRHNSNTELIAQGVGNLLSGLFGGIPATGAIARTAANVKNGGRSPISGMVHAVILVLFLLVLMPVAKMIPMPIIAAILFIVAYNMSSWRMFVRICKRSPKTDIFILILSFFLTVFFDLVVAIAVGLLLAAVLFMKRMSDLTYVRHWDEKEDTQDEKAKEIPEGTEVYEINGPMFFADADKFIDFDLQKDTRVLILRMSNVPSIDATAMKHLEDLYHKCKKKGITLMFSHVNKYPMEVMKKAGLYRKIGARGFTPTIDDALSAAQTIQLERKVKKEDRKERREERKEERKERREERKEERKERREERRESK